jgi:hypothetical protein
MCTEQLPPGGYPIAVKYIISYENKQPERPTYKWDNIIKKELKEIG